MADARAQEGRLALSAPAAFLVGPEAAASVCPFLGALDDVGVLGDAVPAYSERNRCTAFGPWLPQGKLQQELVCLTVAHETCPRYTRGVRYGPSGPRRRAAAAGARSGLVVLGLAVLAVLALGAAIVLGQGLISGPLSGLFAGTTSTPTPTATTVLPTATPASTASPTAEVTPSPTPAPTPAPTPKPTATPAPATRTYTVVAGDTLYGIAKKFNVSVAAIRKLNPSVQNTNVIHVGQKLKIPA